MHKLRALKLRAHAMLTEPGEPGGGGVTPPEGGTFTQADVDRIVGEAVAKAKRGAERTAADELAGKLPDGVELDALVQAYTDRQEAERAAMTEAERVRTDAAAAVAQLEADRAAFEAEKLAAAAELHTSRVQTALVRAGVPDDAVAAVNLPGVDVGADAETIAAAVENLKAKVPALFTSSTTIIDADPGKPGGKPAGEVGGKGLAEFQRRHPELVKG